MNDKLGWRVELELGNKVSPFHERELAIVLYDASDHPLDGAEVEVTTFPHARGYQRETVLLPARGEGRYAGNVRFRRKGLWEFRVIVQRGPETFTHMEVRDVYPPGESRPWPS